MIRVTYNQINRKAQFTINQRFADLAHLQEQLSTGKRLMRPSDDPVDVANDLQLRSKLMETLQLRENINDGTGFMSVTGESMRSMNNLFHRLRELGIQAASETLTGNERRFILKETEELLRQIISLGNTKFKGEYIFAGTQTKITPLPLEESMAATPQHYTNRQMAYYTSAGPGTAVQLFTGLNPTAVTRIIPGTFHLALNNTEYVEGQDFTVDYTTGMITPLNAALDEDLTDGGAFGSGPPPQNYAPGGFEITFEYVSQGRNIHNEPADHNGLIYREIETGIVVPVNITQDELMQDYRTGTHVLDAVIGFGQSLIESDTQDIQRAIGEIDDVFKHLLDAQSKNGARLNRFETTLDRNEARYNETTRLQSVIEDVDFAEAATKFSLLETVYNAALKSTARVLQPSLADFI